MAWFYEFDGKEHGPVPEETLAHLAKHGAISRATLVRREAGQPAVLAGQVAFLESHLTVNGTAPRQDDSGLLVKSVLSKALETIRNGVDAASDPALAGVVHISRCLTGPNKVALLDYRIECLEPLPTDNENRSASLKRVSRRFKAIVQAKVCKPLSWTDSIDELNKHATEQRNIAITYDCCQLEGGHWSLVEVVEAPLR